MKDITKKELFRVLDEVGAIEETNLDILNAIAVKYLLMAKIARENGQPLEAQYDDKVWEKINNYLLQAGYYERWC